MNKIKIGGIIYEIKIVERLSCSTGSLDGQLRHGETTINLDKDLNAQALAQALLHEMFHVVFTQLGRTNMKENDIDSLAFSMLQVLRDNPGLVKLIEDLDG